MIYDVRAISSEEASVLLYKRCVELIVTENKYEITADPTIRVLTQRLYGDYRQVVNTAEYKRAEKHVNYFKNTGLGRELF